jgi:hypothetical protein
MLAIHLDNILFLLFIAVAILFQLLTRAATKSGRRPGSDPQRRSTSSTSPRREETEEDRIRKFLEALGQPTTSKPPPLAVPRTDIPPRPVAPIAPPREMVPDPTWRTLKRELQREIKLPQQIPSTREARTFTPKVAEAPIFEARDVRAPLTTPAVIKSAAEAYAVATASVPQAPAPRIDIATLLRTTSGLRQAILLREIFGPPRSLQPLDLVGSV